tara:strand:+ start:426 stop:1046 length:621 start_codon:yes stop_codon:yes gene_type:complete
MFALVEDGSITKFLSGNRGITIGDNQYPKAIFTLWTKSEREAIGIYEVEMDISKFKDEKWYINTNITYSFGSGKVTGSYGDATAKAHADTLYTAQDETDGLGTEGEVKAEGLKTILIRNVKAQANQLLSETDWYVTRKTEKSTAIPSNITTWRNGIRSKQAAMETAITNASDTPALETLYAYVNTADEGDPVVIERPLGEFPELGS